MRNTLREVRGFRALSQKIRNYLFKKLNIHNLNRAQYWDWREGAKETLNPIPAIRFTLQDIWKDRYTWIGGTWIDDPEMNPDGITKDMKLNFLSKCYCSWIYVFKPLLRLDGFNWRYGNGLGSFGWTSFKWWTLTHYRDHTYWQCDKFEHNWKDKKFLFSKNWKDYDHQYIIHGQYIGGGDPWGIAEEEVSEEKFNAELEKWEEFLDE